MAKILHCGHDALPVHSLPTVSLVCSEWRAVAAPLLAARARADVASVLAHLVTAVAGHMAAYEPDDGVCLGCGLGGAALSQCESCGAPVEPVDGSWHFSFGWLEGPRCEVGDEVWVRVGGDEVWDYVTERGVVSEFWEVLGAGDEDRALEYI